MRIETRRVTRHQRGRSGIEKTGQPRALCAEHHPPALTSLPGNS